MWDQKIHQEVCGLLLWNLFDRIFSRATYDKGRSESYRSLSCLWCSWAKKKSSKSLSSDDQESFQSSFLSKQTNSHSSLIMMGCLTFTTISAKEFLSDSKIFYPFPLEQKMGPPGFQSPGLPRSYYFPVNVLPFLCKDSVINVLLQLSDKLSVFPR